VIRPFFQPVSEVSDQQFITKPEHCDERAIIILPGDIPQ
jgi:hypothetical protein